MNYYEFELENDEEAPSPDEDDYGYCQSDDCNKRVLLDQLQDGLCQDCHERRTIEEGAQEA